MSDWPSMEPRPRDTARRRPRALKFLIGVPIAALLLFSAVTGRIGIIQAFSPGSDRLPELDIPQGFDPEGTVQARNQGEPEPTLTPQVQATPAGPTARGGRPEGLDCAPGDPFCLYTVSEGDSLASLAERFSLGGGEVPGWELLYASNLPDLEGLEDALTVGQVLRVPMTRGVLHTVMPAESLMELAVGYGVSSAEISEVNAIADPDSVGIGDVLLIPEPAFVWLPVATPEPTVDPEATATPRPEESLDVVEEHSSEEENAEAEEQSEGEGEGERTPQAQPAQAEAQQQEQPQPTQTPVPQPTQTPAPQPTQAPAPPPTQAPAPEDVSRMSWPVVQPLAITNYMTARHPLGMDFGLRAAPRSEIMAAASGTVVFSGGDPCCSYGYYVIVDHGNGLQSLYGHLSSLYVSKGQSVGRGQALGIAGNTGYSRGVHLHFEVQLNGQRVNPMNYLPGN